jgi:hypothetical protein
MSVIQDLIKWAESGALEAVKGQSSSASPNPLSEIVAVIGALHKVCSDVAAGTLTLSDTFTLVNAVQAVLVDAGVEPGAIEKLSQIGEAGLPLILSAYQSGLIQGGYRPLDGEENSPRGKIGAGR